MKRKDEKRGNKKEKEKKKKTKEAKVDLGISKKGNLFDSIVRNSRFTIHDNLDSKYWKIIKSNPELEKLNLELFPKDKFTKSTTLDYSKMFKSDNQNSYFVPSIKKTKVLKSKPQSKPFVKIENSIQWPKICKSQKLKSKKSTNLETVREPSKRMLLNPNKVLKALRKKKKNTFYDIMAEASKSFSQLSKIQIDRCYADQILKHKCSHPINSYFTYFFGTYSVLKECDCFQYSKKLSVNLSQNQATETKITIKPSSEIDIKIIENSPGNQLISDLKFERIKIGLQNLNFDVILHREFFEQNILLTKNSPKMRTGEGTVYSGEYSNKIGSFLKINTINFHKDNYTVKVKTLSNFESHEICRLGTGTQIDLSKIDFSQSEFSRSKASKFKVRWQNFQII